MLTRARLVYRNSRGEFVEPPDVAATRLKSECGTVLDEAMQRGAVVITRHDTPKAVLVSYEEFQALVREQSPSLSELRAEYDVLLARMQKPAAKAAMAAAFDAAPAQIGRAANKAAQAAAQAARKRR